MKASFMQRLLAYLIDIFIVSFIFSIFSVFIPNNEISEYNKKLSDAESKMIETMQSGNSDNYKDMLDEVVSIQYEMSRASILRDSVLFVITFGYFVILQFCLKGKTIGKMILKIKVVQKNNKEPSMGAILLRTFIVQGLLSSFIAIVTILFIDKNFYTYFNGIISVASSIFIIVSALMILYRKDKKGLHDMMAGTSVVSYKE